MCRILHELAAVKSAFFWLHLFYSYLQKSGNIHSDTASLIVIFLPQYRIGIGLIKLSCYQCQIEVVLGIHTTYFNLKFV